MTYTEQNPLRVAVIGSGPSGIFATEALLKSAFPVRVDVFERLPTPFGLVRYGVAPDHLTIKSVTRGFEKTLSDSRVRFFGHVEFGKDISHEDLKARYHALVYTVGASRDRRLGIAGEDLAGSMSATDFVAWYNGHPDAADRDMKLAEGVAVIGVGNVALDVSRILLKTTAELRESDIAPHALDALEHSPVKKVWLLGRRGAAQAAFTTKELREFGELSEAEPVVLPQEIALSDEEKAAISDPIKRKNLEVLQSFADRELQGKPRQVHLRFLVSPVEVLGDEEGRVRALKIQKNRLDEAGNAIGTGEYEELPVGMVLRSVGYRGSALPDVPFDEVRGVIPNTAGRVEGRVGEYTAGWVGRGANGVVGTNRKDASDTVAGLLADAEAGLLTSVSGEDVAVLLAERGVAVFGLEHWRILDAYELEEGKLQGRPRVKLTRVSDMLERGAADRS